MQPPERAAHVGGVSEIVQAVQTADGGIHGAVQIQLRHGLMQENGRHALYGAALAHGRSQHLLGAVHTDKLIPAPRQQPRHGAGAAGQIQHHLHGDAAAAEQLFQKVRPLFVSAS